jgi:putative PIG3 family NAD(P)H quinone oxidoreductase
LEAERATVTVFIDAVERSVYLSPHMRAIVIDASTHDLHLREVPIRGPGELAHGEVRVRIRACGVNRADLLQRRGGYAAPPGAPRDIPGLEIAGVVDAIGPDTVDLRVGDRVFGVVSGGAYAEAIVVHARSLSLIPSVRDEPLGFVAAAAIPEAFVTAYDAMVLQCGLAAGETVLVHAAGSGVGTAAVQIARAVGARPIGTARTKDKLRRAESIGLSGSVVMETVGERPKFADRVREMTGGRGVDVVLDLVGGNYVPESLAALAHRGRLVLVGLMAGPRAELDLGLVLRHRLRIVGTVLRSRPLEEKLLAGQVLSRHLAPLIAEGKLVPIVDRVFPLEQATEALAYMESNAGFGKTVLDTQ